MTRHAWNALLALLLATLCCLSIDARAQSCTPQWSLLGASFTGTQAAACDQLVVRFATYDPSRTYTLNTCTLVDTTLTAQVSASDGAGYDVTGTLTSACEPELPASDPGEFAGFTQSQSSNLLAWGFLVLLFGVGFIGGGQR